MNAHETNLLVRVNGTLKVNSAALLGLDEVVAVNGGGHSNAWQTTGDKLQHGHLRSGVLHGNTVGAEAEVALTSHNVLQSERRKSNVRVRKKRGECVCVFHTHTRTHPVTQPSHTHTPTPTPSPQTH